MFCVSLLENKDQVQQVLLGTGLQVTFCLAFVFMFLTLIMLVMIKL